MKRTPFLVLAAFATALMGHAGELPDFADFDADDDGLISEAEFVSHKTGDGRTTEAEAVAKFGKFDMDANGSVSEEEFVATLEAWKARQAQPVPETSGLTN
ncbi:MAG: EF-hand domain-containing protein [Hyphomonas sp.]|uniref:EF-hand domain-containing protein n=1 Tax=Hyphomonas sp. TaxID=87 RepID=UPI003526D1E2